MSFEAEIRTEMTALRDRVGRLEVELTGVSRDLLGFRELYASDKLVVADNIKVLFSRATRNNGLLIAFLTSVIVALITFAMGVLR